MKLRGFTESHFIPLMEFDGEITGLKIFIDPKDFRAYGFLKVYLSRTKDQLIDSGRMKTLKCSCEFFPKIFHQNPLKCYEEFFSNTPRERKKWWGNIFYGKFDKLQ